MRRLMVIPVVLIACLTLGGVVSAGSDVHAFLGQKKISDSDVEDIGLEDMSEFGLGVNLDFEWPVKLTVDVLVGSDDHTYNYTYTRGPAYDYTVKYDLETTELHTGARYEFLKDGKIKPYIGGGLAWVQADAEIKVTADPVRGVPVSFSVLDDDDSDLSFFLNAGVLFEIGSHFNLGLDLRHSEAEADLTFESLGRGTPTSFTVDVGGFHYGLTAGYRW